MLLLKKIRMIQLLVELLSKKIMFPFTSECVRAAIEMKNTCESREEEREEGDDEINELWQSLEDMLNILLRRAKQAGIEDGKLKDNAETNPSPNDKDRIRQLEEELEAKDKQLQTEIEATLKAVNQQRLLERQVKEMSTLISDLKGQAPSSAFTSIPVTFSDPQHMQKEGNSVVRTDTKARHTAIIEKEYTTVCTSCFFQSLFI